MSGGGMGSSLLLKTYNLIDTRSQIVQAKRSKRENLVILDRSLITWIVEN